MSECTRCVMRYYGGKYRIAADIAALMPEHDVYVEPFGGAASVMLAKAPAPCEVYNDLCGDVVNVFRQLRDSSEVLLRGLFLTPYAREEYLAAYEPTSDPVEAARRFIFRSTAGLGSDSSRRVNGFRTSLEGRYAHAHSWATLPPALTAVCERMRGVIIENKNAIDIMEQFDRVSALHYVDPPYLASTRKKKTKSYKHEMLADEEHVKLLDVLLSLKGKVLISGYDHEIYHSKLKGWRVREYRQRDQRNAHRKEVVWLNYEPPVDQPDLFEEQVNMEGTTVV